MVARWVRRAYGMTGRAFDEELPLRQVVWTSSGGQEVPGQHGSTWQHLCPHHHAVARWSLLAPGSIIRHV